MIDTNEATREFEQFLYREARLMDANQYDDWFHLWTTDAQYWVPGNSDDMDPSTGVSIIYDDYENLLDRVLRLKSKFAHAQSPKSRLMRSVSNIVVEKISNDGISGTSQVVIGEIRHNQQNVWFGRAHHELVRTDQGLRIRRKKVFMLNNDVPINNMTFLI